MSDTVYFGILWH